MFLITPLFSLKIFLIAPGWSSSHVIFNYRISKMLSDRGHNVTILLHMIGNPPFQKSPDGIEVIKFVPKFSKELRENVSITFQSMAFEDPNFSTFNEMTKNMRAITLKVCQEILDDHDLIDYLRFKKFDITLSHFMANCPVGWSHRIGVEKFVWIATGAFVFEHVAYKISLPHIPSYMPSHMSKGAGDKMNFRQRATNLFWSSLIWFFMLDEKRPMIGNISENLIFRQPPYHTASDPDLWTLAQKTMTILINGEPFLDFPKPYLPGMVHMGDLEQKVVKKLPEEWQTLMDTSDAGVILFSFGTVANTSLMPISLKESFLKAFIKFPNYTILWRLEGQLPEGLDKYAHIHLVKWIPQSDLLHHKKMKLFITHGGYNSFFESTQASVPMLLMPLLIDQYGNAERAKRKGIGLVLDKYKSTADSIEMSIRTVLTDPSFAKNARYMASVLNDQVIPNQLAALHQIEKMAKSGPLWAKMATIKSAQKLSLVQFFCLDVAAMLLAILAAIIYVIALICVRVWRFIQKQDVDDDD